METNPNIFEKTIIVEKDHLDKQQHVNNVQYVQWVQEVAEDHWESKASPKQKENHIWVVVRHEIDYKKEAFLGDEILLHTYVSDTTHVTCLRHVIIRHAKTGKLLAKAKTTWCLLDAATKRPVKISDELKTIFLS